MSTSPTSSQLTLIFESLASLSRGIETKTHAPSATVDGLHGLSGQEEGDDNEQARSLFLTLHVLFPHELLPALDLLDRGLVTRLLMVETGRTFEETNPFGSTTTVAVAAAAAAAATRQPHGPSESEQTEFESESTDTNNNEVFYVQSSNASTSNRHHHRSKHSSTVSTPFYEVRLDSWNCTCPAFSVAAFQSLNTTADGAHHDESEPDPESRPGKMSNDDGGGSSPSWRFGGVATNTASTSSSSTTPNLRPPSCKHILAAVLAKAAPRLFRQGITHKVVNRDGLAGWGAGWGEFGGG